MKAQVSFEFIVLFTLGLFIFIVIGTLFVSGFNSSNTAPKLAINTAYEIKLKVIAASLTEGDFTTTYELPIWINNVEPVYNFYADPDNAADNLIIIKDEQDNDLARVELPRLDGYIPTNPSGRTLIINKQSNLLTIERI